MARPVKEVIDYFPHMVNQGKTILILRDEFGNDGYAFWFCLLELLCKTDGQFYDYNNPAEWRLLLAQTHVKEETAIKILAVLSEVGAIDAELYQNKVIWVQKLVDNLDKVYDRRTGGKPLKPSYCEHKPLLNSINVNNNSINVNNNRHSRVNNSKQDNSRQNNRERKLTKKTYGQFQNVLLTNDQVTKLKEKFNGRYEETIENFSMKKSAKGYKYESDYAAILSWERSDEKKVAGNSGGHYPAGDAATGKSKSWEEKQKPSEEDLKAYGMDGDAHE